jgi:hypothetical protein
VARELPPPASSPANRCRREGCCFTFDEGTSDNHVATLVIDPRIRAASRFTAPYDHYSLVRTIEDVFGLGYVQHASDLQKTSLADILPH